MSMDQEVLNIPCGQQKSCAQGLLQIRLQALGVPESFVHWWLVHAELQLSFLFNSRLSHRARCAKVNSLKITTGKMNRSECNQSGTSHCQDNLQFSAFLSIIDILHLRNCIKSQTDMSAKKFVTSRKGELQRSLILLSFI